MADPRHVGIAMTIGISVMVAGVLLFGGSSEAAMQVTALVGFFTVFGIFHFLDERARARRKNKPQ